MIMIYYLPAITCIIPIKALVRPVLKARPFKILSSVFVSFFVCLFVCLFDKTVQIQWYSITYTGVANVSTALAMLPANVNRLRYIFSGVSLYLERQR